MRVPVRVRRPVARHAVSFFSSLASCAIPFPTPVRFCSLSNRHAGNSTGLCRRRRGRGGNQKTLQFVGLDLNNTGVIENWRRRRRLLLSDRHPSSLIPNKPSATKMVMNDDEAQRCLDLAKQKFRAGDLDGAIKFARKAQSLSPNLSEEATDYIEFLQIAQQRAAKEEARSNASSSSSASPSPKPPPPQQEGVRHRAPKHAAAGSGSESASTPSASGGAKEYTSSQVEAVKEVLKVRHDYYKCLGVEKTVDEITLKKAYRKKALLFHPDKNGAPGADEAFKVISRAWEVLSDETLKRRYDQTGVDPGSRQSMAGPGGGGGPGGMYGPGMQFEGAMSPEDLFNLFFGAGGPGGERPTTGAMSFEPFRLL